MIKLYEVSLTAITYSGSNLGQNFTMNLQASGESTAITLPLPFGVTTMHTEMLFADVAGTGLISIPVSVAAQLPNGASGSNSQVFTVDPFSTQYFHLDVAIVRPGFPPANLGFDFVSVPRDMPGYFLPETLCSWPYIPLAYSSILCTAQGLTNFSTLPETTQISSLLQAHLPNFAAINSSLSLPFSPAGAGLFDLLDYALDTSTAAVYRAEEVTWRRKLKLSEFLEGLDTNVAPYIDRLVDVSLAVPPPDPLCREWFRLLNCYCRICQGMGTLPPQIAAAYNMEVAPQVNMLHSQAYQIAIDEYIITPMAYNEAEEQCRRLRYILSLFERRCRGRYCVTYWLPSSQATLSAQLESMTPVHAGLTALLDLYGIYICTTEFQTFCTRWNMLLGCLLAICARRGEMPTAVANDFESTFGGPVRTLYLQVGALWELPQPGIDKTCLYLQKINTYMQWVCALGYLPGSNRFQVFLGMLGQLEAALAGFTNAYGDLCATTVTVTQDSCDDWLGVLGCLARICEHRYDATDGLITQFRGNFESRIGGLWSYLNPNIQPDVTDPGPRNMDALCWKLGKLMSFFGELCAGPRTLDPFLKLRLDQELAGMLGALAVLESAYQHICDETVPPLHCDTWKVILRCLQRFCQLRYVLHPAIVEMVFNAFAPLVDYLHWMVAGSGGVPSAYYAAPETYALTDMCQKVDDLVDYFDGICLSMEVDPIVSMRLEELLPDWTTAYNTVLQIPGLCGASVPEEVGCEDYMEMLECLTSLCRRRDEVSEALITQFLANFSGPIDAVYQQIHGSRPNHPAGSLDLLCAELDDLYDTVAVGCCGAPADGEPDEQGGVVPNPQPPGLDGPLCESVGDDLAALLPAFRTLQQQLFSLAFSGGPNICNCFETDCDALAVLPRLYELLCCREHEANFLALAPIVSIAAWYQQIGALLQQIILRTGLNPLTTVPATDDFCGRLQHALSVLVYGFSSPGTLTALQRYELRVRYRQLRSFAMQYAKLAKDDPRPCDRCDVCSQWLEMISCLCRLCAACEQDENVALLFAEESGICQRIDAMFDHIIAAPGMPVPVEFDPQTALCCEKLRWLARFFSLLCLQCGPAGYQTYGLDGYYESLHPAYLEVREELGSAGDALCGSTCGEWAAMLECLVKLVTRPEVPQAIRAQIDGLLGSTVNTLHMMVAGGAFLADPLPETNPAPEAVTPLHWKMVELLRAFHWLCSPYYLWNDMLRGGMDSLLPQFRSDYGQIMKMVADSGLGVCGGSVNICDRLQEFPEYFTVLCERAVPIADDAGPGAVIDQLIDGYADEFGRIATQLDVSLAGPQSQDPLCNRIAFALQVIAVAYSRFDELSPQHRLMVDFFHAVFTSQYAGFRATLADPEPPPGPIAEFRRNWMELLGCICGTCDLLAGMSSAQQSVIQDVVTRQNEALAEIHTIYDAVLPLAAAASMPIAADPCAVPDSCGPEDLCRKLRIVASFFATYCLGCRELDDQQPNDVATLLQGSLTMLRGRVVALRSQLAKHHISVCPEQEQGPVLIQSDYLYLQAAGSSGDAGDGSAAGVHLRWTLAQNLGRNHIPKGNLATPNGAYPAPGGFNQPDDFVRIYRTPYTDRYPVTLDLIAEDPVRIYTLGDAVVWVYTFDGRRSDFLAADPDFPDASRTSIALRFMQGTLYDAASNGLDVAGSPSDRTTFFDAYTGIMEMEPEKPFFRFRMEVQQKSGQSDPEVLVEAISQLAVSADDAKAGPVITARRRLPGTTGPHDLFAESARFARFRCDRCGLRTMAVETCHDYYYAIDRRYGWRRIGRFALSVDDEEVLRRLEDAERFLLHRRWPKYNDTPYGPANDIEKVNVCNYRERWRAWEDGMADAPYPAADYGCTRHSRRAGDSIRDVVVQYLEGSTADNPNPPVRRGSIFSGDITQIELGALDLLTVAAQDFHVARMLGLGYIDWEVPGLVGSPAQRYIYVAEYTTAAALEHGVVPAGTVHRYLSLPTNQQDHRLPVQPQFSTDPPPIQLGLLPYRQGTAEYTDGQGYTKYGDARYVRLYKAPIDFDRPLSLAAFDPGDFFQGAEFSRADNTRPVFYGVRYYRQEGGGFHEVLPQISNDLGEYAPPGYVPFTDTHPAPPKYPQGYPEPLGVIEPVGGRAFFVHHIVKPQSEAEVPEVEGIHNYGIYGINWFSRVSGVTRMADGDAIETKFPKRSTLLPPGNLRVQYITDENPRIFTSRDEQDDIDNLRGWTRVTFEWNQTQNIAYQRGKRVDFFFRDSPAMIRGIITKTRFLPGNEDELQVDVGYYTDYSVRRPEGGRRIYPAVPDAGYAGRFVGALFTTADSDERWIVSSIAVDPAPISIEDDRHAVLSFLLKRVARVGDDSVKRYFDPKPKQYFICTENLNADGPWEPLPGCDIGIRHFPGDYIETDVDQNGNEVRLTAGGVYAPATVTLIPFDPDDPAPPGIYKVEFASDVLPVYAESVGAHVKKAGWYGGTARMSDQAGVRRNLQVTRMDMAGAENDNRTTIYLFDPETAGGGVELEQGPGVDVNFHPGYRAYISLTAAGIAASRIEPGGAELTRNTVIAAWSVDPDQPAPSAPDPYTSPLTPPAVHVARRIFALEKPELPTGALFATRPNIYGKSSYSFDTIFRTSGTAGVREPYGMMFYRASQLDILRAFYAPGTIADILSSLPDRAADEHFHERWSDLVNWVYDTAATPVQFRDYGDGYRFPVPDRSDYSVVVVDGEGNEAQLFPFDGALDLEEMTPYVTGALETVLLPLTERPVIYLSILSDPGLVTSPARPVLRDSDGQPLDPDDPLYDPSPMIRRRSGEEGTEIRCTDYTLDGATSDFYFYCTREIDVALKPGPLSGVLGPVRLIDAYAPEKPAVRKVEVDLGGRTDSGLPRVVIHVSPYLDADNIGQVKLYRTYDPAALHSTAAMDLVKTAPRTVGITDDFSVGALRYNEPIYYRVVACRAIINEQDEVEYIPSEPSDVVVANVVDARNPAAPVITPDPAQPGGAPPAYASLTLTWLQTAYHGTYYFYRKDSYDNWVLEEIIPHPTDPNATMSRTYHDLPKEDGNGNEIFHQFKVVAENSAGLRSLVDNVLTV